MLFTFVDAFKTLILNAKQKAFRENIKKDFMLPMASQMLKRFSKYNKADFFDISKAKGNFIDTVKFVFAEAGMSYVAITAMLEDCANYLQSSSVEDKAKGLELLKEEVKVKELCKLLVAIIVNSNFHEMRKSSMEKVQRAVSRVRDLKIIEMICINSPTNKLIKKSSELIKLMVITGNIPPNFAELLWTSYSPENVEASEAVLSLTAEIAAYGSQEVLLECYRSWWRSCLGR